MYLIGCFLQGVFTLACGFSQNGTQLIIHSFPPGRRQSIAFAAMGGGQPAGFGTGMVLSGIFTSSIGWRWGFWIAAIVYLAVLVIMVRRWDGLIHPFAYIIVPDCNSLMVAEP